MKNFLILSILLVIGGNGAHAGTFYSYTCPDGLTTSGGVSCTGTGSLWTGWTSGAGYVGDRPTDYYNLTSGGTYYVTVNLNGSGRVTFGTEGDGGSAEVLGLTDSVLEQSFTARTDTDITWYIYGGTGAGGNASNNFIGELGDICIDDDGVSCTPPPEPPPLPPFPAIFGTTLATTSTTTLPVANIAIVDIPVLDLFLGILLFYLTMAGVIYFFRK